MPNRDFFYQDLRLCRAWCADGVALHLGMHPIGIRFICFIDPFFSGLLDFILYFPLRRLGFASGGDLLDIGHDTIHNMCFSSIIGRTLGVVMAWLVTFKACDRHLVPCFPLLALRGIVWVVSWLSCWRGVGPCMGHDFARLGVLKRPSRFGARGATTTFFRESSIIT